MPLWTLFGLAARQGRPRPGRWPSGRDGQDGLLGMPRYHPELCDDDCKACADVCPTEAITMRASAGAGGRLDVDYGRCVVCQLCTEACPTGAMTHVVRLGLRCPHGATTWSGTTTRRRGPPPATQAAARVPAQPAYPPRRCRLLQRLRIRTAGAQQSILQSAPARHFLHPLAALRRPAAGDRAGDARHARPLRATYDAMAGAALGAWRSAPARCPAASPTAAMPAATGSTASSRSMSICPAVRPIPRRSSQALLMFLDRAPQRVKGGQLGE